MDDFTMFMRICGCGLGLCLLTVFTGCGGGESTVAVKGKIVKGGQPLAVDNRADGTGRFVNVELVGEEGVAVGSATAGTDGTFTISNARPGTFKLAVSHIDVGGGGAGGPPGGGPPPSGPPVDGDAAGAGMDTGDSLKGQFSAQSSPITVTISESAAGGDVDLGTIDLDKPDTFKISR